MSGHKFCKIDWNNVFLDFLSSRAGLKYRICCLFDIMSLLPDRLNCGLRMRRECRGRFPRYRLQRKPLVTHLPWCMSGSLTQDGGENVPGISGACATRNFTYLVRGPCITHLVCCRSMNPTNIPYWLLDNVSDEIVAYTRESQANTGVAEIPWSHTRHQTTFGGVTKGRWRYNQPK